MINGMKAMINKRKVLLFMLRDNSELNPRENMYYYASIAKKGITGGSIL